MEKVSIAVRDSDDWEVLQSFLPSGWDAMAKELGALRRCRKFPDAQALLRTLLIHLVDGCSLRETAVRAREGRIVDVSDVALLKRLRVSGEWLRWMAEELMQGWVDKQPSLFYGNDIALRVIDGSTIQEPGATGTTWRIHYSVHLPTLQCDEVYVTNPKTGESFKNFNVNPGDVFMGDRGYANRASVAHVYDQGGDVIIRTNLTGIPFTHSDGSRFALLERLRTLKGTRIGQWTVFIRHEGELIPGRLCALKKDKRSAERARKKALAEGARKGRQVRPETVEAAGYTFVFTTLPRAVKPSSILELYRGRWQVELAFKRMKSLLSLGHLKKLDPDSAKAWIHGKLMVAFLLEALIAAGDRFSPWGYPLSKAS